MKKIFFPSIFLFCCLKNYLNIFALTRIFCSLDVAWVLLLLQYIVNRGRDESDSVLSFVTCAHFRRERTNPLQYIRNVLLSTAISRALHLFFRKNEKKVIDKKLEPRLFTIQYPTEQDNVNIFVDSFNRCSVKLKRKNIQKNL